MLDYSRFQKPQRYIGNEWNVVRKTHDGRIPVCIGYPDIYDVGMSNVGLRIIYGLLNSSDAMVCERVFLPGPDYIAYLLTQHRLLCSLETKTPLREFQVLGFNLSCELNATNVLRMLELSGIERRALNRTDLIVIGGGVANPEPMAAFFDVFCLGEFEEVALEFIRILQRHPDKEARLAALSCIPGFYVPAFYRHTRHAGGYSVEKSYGAAQFPLRRAYVKSLDEAYYPIAWLVPHTSIVHDRVQIEIARGCPNRCTFCQARGLYHPYRVRSPQVIGNLLRSMYAQTGYEDFSFLALSASDYPGIENLVDETIDYCRERAIGLSLPSLRIDDIIGGLYRKLIPLKKTSLTCAVEVAGDGLRESLNKKIDVRKLFEAAHILRSLKVGHLKLYFMFGFPGETEDDLIAIGTFLRELQGRSRLSLNVSINAFVPKPFSLWENVPMIGIEHLLDKRTTILRNIPSSRWFDVSIAPLERTILEAVICRADRRFAGVIERIFLNEEASGGLE
ncbi:MAG: radical SAM protein, partial [Candidatus Omnitrophica bacterium]|nr:radical SAM protein [Candidatus Omnitrophota bacterium]